MTGPADSKDIKVSTDHGLLRLGFSSAISRRYFGRRQVFKSLGWPDTPENREKALKIIWLIQSDFDNDCFDQSLDKYLNDAIAKNSSNFPCLLMLWDEYSIYALNSGIIGETTYKCRYARTFKNWIAPWGDRLIDEKLVDEMVTNLIASPSYRKNLRDFFSALRKMGERAYRLGNIPKNYFQELEFVNIKIPRKSVQLASVQDYKAYSQVERDLIINSFYSSKIQSVLRLAPLIEFLFLTGCRIGEVIALKWHNINPQHIIFDESYSSEAQLEKATKTNITRLFRTEGYTKLLNLIDRIRPEIYQPDDYVFNRNGKRLNRMIINKAWYGSWNGEKFTPGIVKKLAEQGKLEYLKPSSTRHTFISIQCRNGVDVKLLADSVGNSPAIIYKYYLGIDTNFSFFDA